MSHVKKRIVPKGSACKCCEKQEAGCSRWGTNPKCEPLFYVTNEDKDTGQVKQTLVMKKCDKLRFRTGGSVDIVGKKGSAIIDLETNNIVIGSGPPTIGSVPNPNVPALYFDETSRQSYIWGGSGTTATTWVEQSGGGGGIGITLEYGELVVGGTAGNEAFPAGTDGQVLSVQSGFPIWTSELSLDVINVNQLNALSISNIDTQSYTVTIIDAISITTGDIFVNDVIADTVTTGSLEATSGTVANLSSTTLTTTTLDTATLALTNLSVATLTSTSLDATSGTVANLSSTTLTTTSLDATSGAVSNLSSTTLTATNAMAETITVSNSLFLTGLSSVPKSNMLYYDSTNGLVTYSTVPASGSGGITLDANGNIIGSNTATVNNATGIVILGEKACDNQYLDDQQDGSISIGELSSVNSQNSIAIGKSAIVNAASSGSIVLGNTATTSLNAGTGVIAIGENTYIDEFCSFSLALGRGSRVISSSKQGVAIGPGAKCDVDNGLYFIGSSTSPFAAPLASVNDGTIVSYNPTTGQMGPGVNVNATNFMATNVTTTSLTVTNLVATNIATNDLTVTNFMGTNVTATDLTATNLIGTNITVTDLIVTNFIGTNVTATGLTVTNLMAETVTVSGSLFLQASQAKDLSLLYYNDNTKLVTYYPVPATYTYTSNSLTAPSLSPNSYLTLISIPRNNFTPPIPLISSNLEECIGTVSIRYSGVLQDFEYATKSLVYNTLIAGPVNVVVTNSTTNNVNQQGTFIATVVFKYLY